MRPLSNVEIERVKLLTGYAVALTLIEPTETGLKKSILDATAPVRSYLMDNQLHNYSLQSQGPTHKKLIQSYLVKENLLIPSTASLYRPNTKQGDPRIWFRGLGNVAKPNDILGIIAFDGVLYVINITSLDVEYLLSTGAESNPLQELVAEISNIAGAIANELLAKLRKIAKKGPIRSTLSADTAVGRTLEQELGVKINSSKQPDYKGIELKAFRGKRGNRKNLFAQVASWNLSKFKSSAEILDAFGYWRGKDFKLYCTVSSINVNSQGLTLKFEDTVSRLQEHSNNPGIGIFAVWSLQKLHQRLLEKHNETFWIEAKSTKEDGVEYFQFTKAEHTRKPIVSQFDILLQQGIITLDHLIKRTPDGKVVEKGPLFKIKPKALDLLFPPSKLYNLC